MWSGDSDPRRTRPTLPEIASPVGTNCHATVRRNFTGATTVTFDGRAADAFTVDDDGTIDAVVPAAAQTGPISTSSSASGKDATSGTSADPFTRHRTGLGF